MEENNDLKEMTPYQYFQFVKSKVNKMNDEDLNKLYSISLYCVDDKSLFDEKLLKQKHDKILNQLGLKELTRFDWGYIESYYEQNSASSIIGIYYK